SDHDYASHELGPEGARLELAHTDAHVASLVAAAGGLDEFLDRYAVVVCSDHGQSEVVRAARLESAFVGMKQVRVTASNRAGMVYRVDGRADARSLAARLDGNPAVDVAVFLEDGRVVARRDGEEGPELLDPHPDGRARALAALRNPNAGDVIVSAAPGWEFHDLGGRHHAGGGSHGSLAAADSEVPLLTIGLDGEAASVTDVASLVLSHFARFARGVAGRTAA
ncbi:MAG TPA: alkaline phosphatase family protein, partial [Gaiellaceae bacterium]|nr:alkaline phosphatase family protein [Gaiellaceae bacterium]